MLTNAPGMPFDGNTKLNGSPPLSLLAAHAAPDRPDEDHNVVERAPDSAAKGDNEREGNVGNASGDSQPQSGHCAHCGSHPHHHRPRHMFHGIHRYR